MTRSQYNHNGCIAIDIDETLIINGSLNKKLIAWIEQRRSAGREIILWSSRGTVYAKQVANKHRITHLFDIITGKPCTIVDDKGWALSLIHI